MRSTGIRAHRCACLRSGNPEATASASGSFRHARPILCNQIRNSDGYKCDIGATELRRGYGVRAPCASMWATARSIRASDRARPRISSTSKIPGDADAPVSATRSG